MSPIRQRKGRYLISGGAFILSYWGRGEFGRGFIVHIFGSGRGAGHIFYVRAELHLFGGQDLELW